MVKIRLLVTRHDPTSVDFAIDVGNFGGKFVVTLVLTALMTAAFKKGEKP